jgi:hypothetical protein
MAVCAMNGRSEEMSRVSPQDVQPPADFTASEMYNLYRDYLKHEDSLVNNRMSWFSSYQSFLLSAYLASLSSTALLRSKIVGQSTESALVIVAICLLTIVICSIGAQVSLHATDSIDAADKAIDALAKKWKTVARLFPKSEYFPGLVGGGEITNRDSGSRFQGEAPRVMFWAWLFLGLIAFGVLLLQVGQHTHQKSVQSQPPSAAGSSPKPAEASTQSPPEDDLPSAAAAGKADKTGSPKSGVVASTPAAPVSRGTRFPNK